LIGVIAVPYCGSRAEIIWVGVTAMPTWVSQQHRSPATGEDTLVVLAHALYWAAMGPWALPDQVNPPGRVMPRSWPRT
jgi:hypothetical protein